MKNSFKIGGLLLALAVSITACDPSKKGNGTKSEIDTPTQKVDTGQKAVVDTAKKDTSKK